MGSFSVETVVIGFHVYNEVWDAAVGEELPCRRDVGNSHDPYAVAMVRASSTCDRTVLAISAGIGKPHPGTILITNCCC